MANVFTKAKALQKTHPNKSWQDLIKMASKGAKTVSKSQNMATKKRRSTGAKTKKRRVSGVTTTTKRKTTTKRRSVGAIVDRQMANIALGMAIEGIAQKTLIQPLTNKLPRNGVLGYIIDPAMAILAYKGSQSFRSPIMKGVMLGIMKTGVDNTVVVLKTKLLGGNVQQMLKSSVGDMDNSQYIPLPAPNVGEIKNFLAGSDEFLLDGNVPNMGSSQQGADYSDTPYLPIGA